MAPKKIAQPKKAKFTISQSFMKDMADYLSKNLCGNVLKAKWVDKIYPDEPSDAQELGSYFEYRATGGLPKSGIIPQPKYMTSAINAKRKLAGFDKYTDQQIIEHFKFGITEMYEPYRIATRNAEIFKAYIERMGFKVVAFGKRVTKGDHEGTIDLILEAVRDIKFRNGRVLNKGDQTIVDMKYSGLIGERWTRFGWPSEPALWTPDQKRYNAFQARQYKYLSDGLPFFFWVTDPKNEGNALLVEATGLNDFTIEQHLAEGRKMADDLALFVEIGFTPWPELKRCEDCPLKEKCADRQMYPEPIQVFMGIED